MTLGVMLQSDIFGVIVDVVFDFFLRPIGQFLLFSAILIVAGFVVRWIWRWFRKPILTVVDDPSVVRDTDNNRRYRVQVRNDGKEGARNCRARIEFTGLLEPQTDSDEEMYRIDISNTVCWSEPADESGITINPGETVAFDVLRQSAQRESLVEFPSEEGWTETTPLFLEPEGMEDRSEESDESEGGSDLGDRIQSWIPGRTDAGARTRLHSGINRERLHGVEWETNRAEVTAENAPKVECTIEVGFEDGTFTFDVTRTDRGSRIDRPLRRYLPFT